MQRNFSLIGCTLVPTASGSIILALFIPLSLLLRRKRYRTASLGCWCFLSFFFCFDGFSGLSAISRGSFGFSGFR